MDYLSTIEFLFSKLPYFSRDGKAAIKNDLNNTIALCQLLGHPEKQFKCIHIAGTNGKGSCSNMLAAVLQMHGYKTGLYTSPHLVDFRERIRINGEMIPEQTVVGPSGAILPVGKGFTTMCVIGEVDEQPFTSVTVTVKEYLKEYLNN